MKTGCGCREGQAGGTPAVIDNLPGQASLAYRVGTFASFLGSMKSRLGPTGLRARTADDPAVALLDAGAVMADVIAFYQERIANEGYLRTAVELRSLIELARMTGYRPRPGVAASVPLAFTVDPSYTIQIPVGQGAQSTPRPESSQKPQTFETIEAIEARDVWSQMKPRLTRPQQMPLSTFGTLKTVYFLGTDTRLKPNDAMLFLFGTSPANRRLRKVLTVEPDSARKWTKVGLQDPAFAAAGPAATAAADPVVTGVYAFRSRAGIFGNNAPLKALFRADNTLLGYEEWQLAKITSSHFEVFSVQLVLVTQAANNDVQIQVTINIANRGDKRYTLPFFKAASRDETYPNPSLSGGVERIHFDVIAEDEGVLSTLKVNFLDRTLNTDFQFAMDPGELGGPIDIPVQVTATGSEDFDFVTTTVNGPNRASHVNKLSGRTPINSQPTETKEFLYLDSVYSQVTGETWMALEHLDEDPFISTIVSAAEAARAEYGISGKVTRLRLPAGAADPSWVSFPATDSFKQIREGVVHVQADPLTLSEVPVTEDVSRGTIEFAPDLAASLLQQMTLPRQLIVSGTLAKTGQASAETAQLSSISGAMLTLGGNLAGVYQRESVIVYGNVADATHGQTVSEYLGNGDGSQANQSFTLKQKPLTYVADDNPTGIASTLQVFVNGVKWREVEDLSLGQPDSHVYVTSVDAAGLISVTFGDGGHGARLPTGVTNAYAIYRIGIGPDGNVGVGQINQLTSKPLGLNSVVNPVASSGGVGPDGPEDLRRNAARSVRGLDRVVSAADYAEFAAQLAGIAKATARRLSDDQRLVVHVTVAAVDDAPLGMDSDLINQMNRALHDFGDPDEPFVVAPVDTRLMNVTASLDVLSGYQFPPVCDAATAALLDHFSFDRREFGQDTSLSEVISVIQGVDGVASVLVTAFGVTPSKSTLIPPPSLTPGEAGNLIGGLLPRLPTKLVVEEVVTASLARFDGVKFLAAQIAIFVTDGITLQEKTNG